MRYLPRACRDITPSRNSANNSFSHFSTFTPSGEYFSSGGLECFAFLGDGVVGFRVFQPLRVKEAQGDGCNLFLSWDARDCKDDCRADHRGWVAGCKETGGMLQDFSWRLEVCDGFSIW